MNRDYALFTKVLSKLYEGLSITFTKGNIDKDDHFLILGSGHDSCTVTFRRPGELWWVCCEHDEPILLEDVPDTFLRSILINL